MAAPAPLQTYRLKIPCADEQEFRERFAPKYLADGIFVPAPEPLAVGTRVHVKLEIRGGRILVSGDAMVTSRSTADRSDKPGMTLRLTALHPESIKFPLTRHAGAVHPTPPAAIPALTPAPPPLSASLTPAPPARAAPPPPLPHPAPPPHTPATPTASRAGARTDLFDLDEPPRPAPAPASPGPPAGAAPSAMLQAEPERPGATPPGPPPPAPATPARPAAARRRLLVAGGAALTLIAAGAVAVAVARKAPAPPDPAAARASAELRLAEIRMREGRLAGVGGDSALEHLLAARAAAPADPRVAARLKLLAEKFEQLGGRALDRKNAAEAAVHLHASVTADPARESARRKLAEIPPGGPGGAPGR